MASSYRSAATSASFDALGRFIGPESRVGRARFDSSLAKLPPTGNSRDRRPAASGSVDHGAEEVKLLALLIDGTPGAESLALSKSLLTRYGTLPAILRRLHGRRQISDDMPPAVSARLTEVSDTISVLWRQESLEGPVISSPDIVSGYLRNDMADLPRETFRVLFLDGSNRVLADETMWEGTVNRVQIHPREVIRLAIETQATALILAHNHPSGNPAPSRHDVAMTNRLISACSPIDVEVHDHIIVANSGWFSMAQHGLIGQNEAETGPGWPVADRLMPPCHRAAA